jgi:hypothetical protein
VITFDEGQASLLYVCKKKRYINLLPFLKLQLMDNSLVNFEKYIYGRAL